MEMVRSFIAIKLPEEIKNKISDLQKTLRGTGADVKWVSPESIHLTLKFLGNIEKTQIEEILSAIKKSSAKIKPFPIEIKSTGVFPKIEYPRVVWIGVKEETKVLLVLQQKIEENLLPMGFEKEGRDFTPHLTLGRVKSQKGKEKLISLLLQSKDISFGKFEVTEINLMQSILEPAGAEYSSLGRVELTD